MLKIMQIKIGTTVFLLGCAVAHPAYADMYWCTDRSGNRTLRNFDCNRGERTIGNQVSHGARLSAPAMATPTNYAEQSIQEAAARLKRAASVGSITELAAAKHALRNATTIRGIRIQSGDSSIGGDFAFHQHALDQAFRSGSIGEIAAQKQIMESYLKLEGVKVGIAVESPARQQRPSAMSAVPAVGSSPPSYTIPLYPGGLQIQGTIGSVISDQSEYKYRGRSGAQYKYDLNQPLDAIMYRADPGAQLSDRINIPINPSVGIDRSLGQRGGGVR